MKSKSSILSTNVHARPEYLDRWHSMRIDQLEVADLKSLSLSLYVHCRYLPNVYYQFNSRTHS